VPRAARVRGRGPGKTSVDAVLPRSSLDADRASARDAHATM
jgi:hypothetical protein